MKMKQINLKNPHIEKEHVDILNFVCYDTDRIGGLEMKKKFLLRWKPGAGSDCVVEGDTIEEAMMLAGYSGGAVRALDYYEEVKENEDG